MVHYGLNGKPDIFWAADFDEAYEKGYFWNSMSVSDFINRITRYNPELRIKGNDKYRGIVNSNDFICGVPYLTTIPRVTLMRYDTKLDRSINWSNAHGEIHKVETLNTDDDRDKVLARGWEPIFKTLEQRGYKIDRKGL